MYEGNRGILEAQRPSRSEKWIDNAHGGIVWYVDDDIVLI